MTIGDFWDRDEMLAEEIRESYARQARGEYPPETPAEAREREVEIAVEEIISAAGTTPTRVRRRTGS